MTLRRLGVGSGAVAALLLIPAVTSAQSMWTNPAGGNWNTPGNWSSGVPAPGPTTSLIFGAAGTQTATYAATNDIGVAGTAFDLNALTVNNTSGTVTIAGNPLNFTGTTPTITIADAGTMIVNVPVTLAATTTVTGSGTGSFTFGGTVTGGTNNLLKTAAGPVTLAAGGTFNQLSLRAGNTFATGGTLALTQPNDPPANAASGLQIGSATGQTATFTASGGAIVNVSENVYVGDAAGSTGTLNVQGPGTVLNNVGGTSGRFAVGNAGAGALNITNGGTVNTIQLFVARSAGGSGAITVDGAGSLLHATAQLSFGSTGLGTMTVQNGGSATSDSSINIGRAVGAGINGIVTVTGAGSSMSAGTATTAGVLTVGTGGPGTLNIQNGATVNVGTAGTAGQVLVAQAANSAGTLNIQSGGLLNITGAFFSALTGPNQANVTVTGANSRLQVSGQYSMSGGGGAGVNAGTSTLNVSAGGRLQAGGNTIFGSNAGGSVTATFDGSGTTYATGGQLQLLNGTNNLTLQNGATGTVTGVVFLSPVAGGTGNLTVTGTGSALNAQASMSVGGSGTTSGGAGTLNVNAGGAVNIATSLFVYPPGTVNVNGGTLTAAALANAIAGSAGPVTTTAGSTINITNGGGATFSGQISGGGAIVKSGAGTQTLGGANNYSGGTTVSAGALGVSNIAGSGTGTGPVNIGSTAFLGGTGTITGPVNVASGGTLTGGLTGTAALNLTGAVTMSSGSTVSIGINGTTPGTGAGGHDQINLGTTGTINLGGSNLSAGVTYAPLNTDVVRFILGTGAGAQVLGTFANAPPGTEFPLGTFMGQPYMATINYTPNSVFFNNFVPVPEPGLVLLMCAGVGLITSRLRPSVRALSRKR